jgi:SAM-dependent methyltransferase
MTTIAPPPLSAQAYDSLAPYYDEFTAGYAHDAWIEAIESRAKALGLRGDRALDLACGTGKSTRPLIARGYDVLACDVSSEMIRVAREKHPDQQDAFVVADIREFRPSASFDLVLCLDDAMNYLLSGDELEQCFSCVAAVLAPGGVFAFDLNTLATYRSAFASNIIREAPGTFFAWRGEAARSIESGAMAAATVEVFSLVAGEGWQRRTSRHQQRHHPLEVVRTALTRSGLRCRAVAGQLRGARLEDAADDQRHSKFVYFAQRMDC